MLLCLEFPCCPGTSTVSYTCNIWVMSPSQSHEATKGSPSFFLGTLCVHIYICISSTSFRLLGRSLSFEMQCRGEAKNAWKSVPDGVGTCGSNSVEVTSVCRHSHDRCANERHATQIMLAVNYIQEDVEPSWYTTHQHTHSDTCNPLTQFHDGKEGDGTERCISQQNSMVEKCFRKRSSESGVQQLQCGRKMVCGRYHEPPWKQKGEDWTAFAKVCRRYTPRRLSVLPISLPSFVRPG